MNHGSWVLDGTRHMGLANPAERRTFMHGKNCVADLLGPDNLMVQLMWLQLAA